MIKNNFNTAWIVTLSLGLIGVILGLLLRVNFVQPLGFNFQYVLHAHSHTMLLGWLLSALLLLLYRQWFYRLPTLDYLLFVAMQFCVLGMLLSFPFQGYAAWSISFSSLHLVLSYALFIRLWRHSKKHPILGIIVRFAIVFHVISSIGPFSLGPLMALQMQDNPWYQQAIFFYLHFQYNGLLWFLTIALIGQKWITHPSRKALVKIGVAMATGTLLTWAHTLDFSFNHLLLNVLGFMGSALQLLAGYWLLRPIHIKKQPKAVKWLILLLVAKLIVQVLGSFPAIADLVTGNRFWLLAYLHFIFLGIFSPLIFHFYLGFKSAFFLRFYWPFFFLTEIGLLLPATFWNQIRLSQHQVILILYGLLVATWLALSFKGLKKCFRFSKI